MIEVHGQHEEYLMTVRGELLDEVDGTSLYECRIVLKKLQPEIFLKVSLLNYLFLFLEIIHIMYYSFAN